MSVKNTSDHYGIVAKGLHWLSALIVLGLLSLGYYMVALASSPFKFDLFWWHKSFGTLLFFIVLIRILWRTLISPPPPHLQSHQPWERALAKLVHFLLYVGMIGMPLTGWLMCSAGDFQHSFFGLFEMPHIAPKNEALFKLSREMHWYTSFALMAAIGLHGIGAFKHHFLDKDTTLLRMLPAFLPGRAGGILAAAVFVILLGSAGWLGANDYFAPEDKPAAQTQAQQAEAPVVQEQPAQTADTTPAPASAAPHWSIIPEQSSIGFTVAVQGQEFQGQFMKFTGDIYFDPENLAESHADMRATTASVHTGSPERDQYIAAKDWMFAESFPESHLATTKIEKTGENQYLAHADLTMRGVTLPVEIPFTLEISDDEATMKGRFTIKRLNYGIGTGEWANPETVGVEPVVEVSLQAKRDAINMP